MHDGISLCLTGTNPTETAKALCVRLVELNHRVALVDASFLSGLEANDSPARACGLLAKDGVIVVIPDAAISPEGERLDVEIDPNDIPEFAAEKILDVLNEKGLVDLEETQYSPEEEEEIRKRLADLGYIE